MLAYLGYSVFSTENGPKGLDFFLKNQFDLVITDLEMPFLDGIDLTDHIKEKSPYTQVVLIAGQGKEVIQTQIRDLPLDRVLFKPFTLWEIEETIQAALNQRPSERVG
jgi:two-component system cell cycle sensor histidine kinase/response regulator CckA